MPTLTIDGQQVEVPAGATVLEAAEKLGIEIPALCFLQGYEPSTSCLVCVVRNRQTGQYVPACATRVVDGMEIDNATEAVSAMRRTALELLLSDHVGDCLAPCFFACPAHMDIPLMLRQIGEHNLREAIATIKQDIALPAVLGRVCPKPCEKGCRRNAADNPVAVCELKRFVADADLASGDPYQPACQPDSGKRVAIVGAGPTGLAAAYYLRRLGHACVLIDRQAQAGGRLRTEPTPEELPAAVLEAEIAQILRLGVETRWNTAVADQADLDRLCDSFDAVLLACGAVEPEQIAAWGLAATRRGIEVDRNTYQTQRPGLFAAGNIFRRKALVVRSTADGKEAAQTMDQYVSGRAVRGPGRPFSSRIHRLTSDEMQEFLAGAGAACHSTPAAGETYSDAAAAEQSNRCLACGCVAHGSCKLERYAILYQADATRYEGQRRPYEVIGRHAAVLFEPGKCIKCELCVKIAAGAQEPLGLTFVGRGFDVKLRVPFGGDMDAALSKVAAECVAACPTAALQFARHATTHPEDRCAAD
ncbi:MAG: FAD-dependent oxidoreductase [Planctomycetaceae bacterium]|nr:FAD-dependent oxidoreductase [Planctomycetaceae bacterium]